MSSISPSLPEEREQILAAAQSVGVFRADELAVVAELFDAYVSRGPQASGYHFVSYRIDGPVLGFACWGPTAMTAGTWDLYWICTAAGAQGKGVAGALFTQAEAAVQTAGGRLIVIYTSSSPPYAAARRFYEKMGCSLSAVVRDYYAEGDDLCVYTKRVDGK